jgi:Phage related protein/Helix-turn-helix
MKTTVQFLDAVKAKHNLPSDYALAKILGITRSGVSKFRVGKDYLGEDTAIKVAELLDLDPGYVMVCIASERAKNPQVKAAWKYTAQLFTGIAAAVAIVAILPYQPIPFDGSSGFLVSLIAADHCILCKIFLFYWPLLFALGLAALYHLPHENRR